MKAKLFKTGNQFLLQSEDGETLGITSGVTVGRKLSIKNCEAIEFGYDLDELAENTYREYPTDLKDSEYHYNRDYQVHKKRKAFIKGFKKAFEIKSDKKFSEDDMLSFESFVSKWYDKAKDIEEFTALPSELLVKWKSLQQTEFDVEIVTKPYTEVGEGFELELKREPKLDKDGCLILRRK